MTTKKEKIEKISESLYEKLFYGKPVKGGEGLGFHTPPGHLKHITDSLAKRIYEGTTTEKQQIMSDIGQVHNSSGLIKLKMWFALLNKYNFKYKITKDEQWVSPENIARKIPDYGSSNITEQQRKQILGNFRHKLVEYKPHKAVMTVNPSPRHNVPYDGTKVGTIPWEDMFPAEHGGNVHPTPQTKPSSAHYQETSALRKSPINLSVPMSDPIPIPGSGQRFLTSPVQLANPDAAILAQRAAAGNFATSGFKRPSRLSSDSLGGGRKSKRRKKFKRRRKTKRRKSKRQRKTKRRRKSSFSKTKRRKK